MTTPGNPSPENTWDPEAKSPEQPTGFFAELWSFVWENKWWWITPTLLILVALACLIFAASGSAIAPFFYALF